MQAVSRGQKALALVAYEAPAATRCSRSTTPSTFSPHVEQQRRNGDRRASYPGSVTAYVPDPRAATATTSEGPTVIVDRVTIADRVVDFPRPLPGAAEYASVVAAEARADALRPQLLEGLDERQEPPWQPNMPLVLDMRGAAGTAVAVAITGMEAFANHHILRAAPSGSFTIDAATATVEQAFDLPVNERYSDVLPPLLNKPRPTNEPWWSTFRRVQRLAVFQRHALYEPQGPGKGLVGEAPLAERLYNGEYVGAAAMMAAAFEHFSPGWFSEERRQALHAFEIE